MRISYYYPVYEVQTVQPLFNLLPAPPIKKRVKIKYSNYGSGSLLAVHYVLYYYIVYC